MSRLPATDNAPPPTRDCRPRLAAFAVYVGAVMFAVRSIPAMAVLLAYVVTVQALAGRVGQLGADARRLWVFAALVIVFNGWAGSGEPVLALAGHTVFTRQGLLAGVFFALRLFALYLSMALLVRSTPPEEFAVGVLGVVRPLSRRLSERLAFFGFMTMSFVPLFASEIERVRVAQSFRGGAFAGRFTDRVRAARLLVVPLVMSAIHRSGQLAAVTELRHLETSFARFARFARPAGAWSVADAVLVLVTAGVVLAAAGWLN